MEPRRVSVFDWIFASGLVVFLASALMPWVKSPNDTGTTYHLNLLSFGGGFTTLLGVLALVAVGVGVVFVLAKLAAGPRLAVQLPVPDLVVYFVIGGLTLLFTILRIVDKGSDVFNLDLDFGFIFGLVGSIAMLAAGIFAVIAQAQRAGPGPAAGYPQPGYPQQGYPPQGYAPQQYPPPGGYAPPPGQAPPAQPPPPPSGGYPGAPPPPPPPGGVPGGDQDQTR